MRYAVIEARWFGRNAERFALEYSSEESLRELIAGPSIIGTGFSSRQEALNLITDGVAVAINDAQRVDAVSESTQLTSSSYDGAPQLRNRTRPQQIWMTPSRLVQQLGAMFVVIVCSRNVLSVAFRAIVGI